jgi:Asp-tRNA(Asn)/Glu-tRNA(Gln) amidotransferase A subunit family amidase
MREQAIARARAMDAELAAGKPRGPLHGIPYAAKDLLDTAGVRTTWGAEPWKDRVPTTNAWVIDALDRAGAVLTAKTAVGALAYGDIWFGGTCRNPWNPEQGSSGSSAGSASSVAAGIVPFAIGTETLGSIVSPCTRCGVSGLRPTFGRVPRRDRLLGVIDAVADSSAKLVEFAALCSEHAAAQLPAPTRLHVGYFGEGSAQGEAETASSATALGRPRAQFAPEDGRIRGKPGANANVVGWAGILPSSAAGRRRAPL